MKDFMRCSQCGNYHNKVETCATNITMFYWYDFIFSFLGHIKRIRFFLLESGQNGKEDKL